MYTFKSRVRYSEVDSRGKLSMTGILNYLQDCSTFQSEDLGVGLDYLSERGIAWVLNYWQVDILRCPDMAEEIEIGTLPYDIKAFMGFRNFFIRSTQGEMLIKANSIWTLLDLARLRPVKPTAEMLEGYELMPKLDMEYLDRKIKVEGGSVREEKHIAVQHHHIDTNQHVNNAQYVSIALDYVDDPENVSRIQAEYKKSARMGDEIYPVITSGDAWDLVSLCDKEGAVYANVLLTKG